MIFDLKQRKNCSLVTLFGPRPSWKRTSSPAMSKTASLLD